MALDRANAGTLPNPPFEYSQEYVRQLIRVLELYFSALDSPMPNHAEQYTAEWFVGGNFFGERFFGKGYFLAQEFQRFLNTASQGSAPLGTANAANLGAPGFANTITFVAPSKIQVLLPGTYRVDYYFQFWNNTAAPQFVDVWLRVNGVDRANTNSKHSLASGDVRMATFSYMPVLASGDQVEIMWAPSDTRVVLAAAGPQAPVAGTNPAIPATPAANVTITLVQANMPPPSAEFRLPRRLRPP